MTADSPTVVATLDNIEELLKDDTKVKIAVLDMDCVLRGKMINKTRFLQTLTNGFGTFNNRDDMCLGTYILAVV